MALGSPSALIVTPAPIEGFAPTAQPKTSAAVVERVPDLEQTRLADRALAVAPEPLPDFDLGREAPSEARTPASAQEFCAACGAPLAGRACDLCGRVTGKVAPPGRQRTTPIVACPTCQSRVPHAVICEKCHTPMPLRELP